MTNLGKELRKIRLDLGINLYDMAKSIGMSSAMLSAVETGSKPAPADLIDRLSTVYQAVQNRRDEFVRLADYTKKEVRIQLEKCSPEANELVFAFARNFDSLDRADIDKLMAVFNKE